MARQGAPTVDWVGAPGPPLDTPSAVITLRSCGSKVVPEIGACIVLPNNLAVLAHHTSTVMRAHMPLFSRHTIPAHRLGIVYRHAVGRAVPVGY